MTKDQYLAAWRKYAAAALSASENVHPTTAAQRADMMMRLERERDEKWQKERKENKKPPHFSPPQVITEVLQSG